MDVDLQLFLVDAQIIMQEFIYETTHLSPEEEDGSHVAKISAATLAHARSWMEDWPRHYRAADIRREAGHV